MWSETWQKVINGIQNVTKNVSITQNAIQKKLEALREKDIPGKGYGQWHQELLQVSEGRGTYRDLAWQEPLQAGEGRQGNASWTGESLKQNQKRTFYFKTKSLTSSALYSFHAFGFMRFQFPTYITPRKSTGGEELLGSQSYSWANATGWLPCARCHVSGFLIGTHSSQPAALFFISSWGHHQGKAYLQEGRVESLHNSLVLSY